MRSRIILVCRLHSYRRLFGDAGLPIDNTLQCSLWCSLPDFKIPNYARYNYYFSSKLDTLYTLNLREVLIIAKFAKRIQEFKNLARIIFIIALLKKNGNSRILNFVKSPKIKKSRNLDTGKLSDLQYTLHRMC